MAKKEDILGDTHVYFIAIGIVFIVVIASVFFRGNSFFYAYVPNTYLNDKWSEDPGERNSGEQFFGLEKWCSFTYTPTLDNACLTFLTVTTLKTMVLMNSYQLENKVRDTIKKAAFVTINFSSEISGERVLNNSHRSLYIIFNGSDTTTTPPQDLNVIGEVWSCSLSGTSIFCIGIAYNVTHWKKIIGDPFGTIDNVKDKDGLIYNVICH